jgi:hypothetical protein
MQFFDSRVTNPALVAGKTILTGRLDAPLDGRPVIWALFSFRYDAHLVDDLLANIAPFAHGYSAFDDRAAADAFTPEHLRRAALFESLPTDPAPDWLLICDPDERFEDRTRDWMVALTRTRPRTMISFNLREMYGPDQIRMDGIWGRKERVGLYPVTPRMFPGTDRLHGRWFGYPDKVAVQASGLTVYHLRGIKPGRRRARRDLYASSDAPRAFQTIGYDYLDDERHMRLAPIAEGRGFSPPHHDDGGLWAPPVLDDAPPDPAWARLNLASHLMRLDEPVQSAMIIDDLCADLPEVPELGLIAAALAASGGMTDRADKLLAAIVDGPDADLATVGMLAQARRTGAEQALALQARAQERHLDAVPQQAPLWRRWVSGPAEVHEGSGNATDAQLTVVVLAYRAPRALRGAVRSIIAQDVAAEIVVVNSGGGRAAALLRAELPRIRLIDVEDRLFVGAARNVGIDASSAPIVAFLAADCLARPGWIRARLKAHAKGAHAVASSVVPHAEGSLVSLAAYLWLHHRRRPDAPDDPAAWHGYSYDRALFARFGYFPPGLRVTEDSVFNHRLAGQVPCAWARDVLTAHRYPRTLPGLILDMFRRGQQRVSREFAGRMTKFPDIAAEIERRADVRHLTSWRLIRHAAPSDWLSQRITRACLRLGRKADVWGQHSRLRTVRRSEALLAAAGDDATSPAVVRAAAVFPQSRRFLLPAAQALARTAGSQDAAELVRRYRAVLDLQPDDPAPLREALQALQRLGRADLALGLADAAVLQCPHLAEARLIAAEAALAAGAPRMAQFHAAMAAAVWPGHRQALPVLAAAAEALGDLPRAAGLRSLIAPPPG